MKADRSDQVILLLPNITENLFLHFIFINVFFFPEGSTSCASTGPDALHTFTKVQTKIID